MAFFKDQLDRDVEILHAPKRIISLVPSQTELLYDLGLNDEVIGITKFCIHPENWFRTKTRVGGTKQLHLEKIKELRPDRSSLTRKRMSRTRLKHWRRISLSG
jgi:ABC-type Fe3+-hydroxamate transport system substrate-binding protein